MRIRLYHRLGNGGLRIAALATWLLLDAAATSVLGQGPQIQESVPEGIESSAAQRIYLNKHGVQLPIQLNDQHRAQVREIQLYVKEQASSPWTLRDRAKPDQKSFLFQAPRDGEYAFIMLTVDKQGRSYPNDIRNEPPGLVVVIDTQPPRLTMTNLGNSAEGQLVQCEVVDANVNAAATQFYFQGGDKLFRPLEPVTGRPNVYCIPVQAVFTGLVRATVVDVAGNRANSQSHISQLPTQKAPVAALPEDKDTTATPLPASVDVQLPQGSTATSRDAIRNVSAVEIEPRPAQRNPMDLQLLSTRPVPSTDRVEAENPRPAARTDVKKPNPMVESTPPPAALPLTLILPQTPPANLPPAPNSTSPRVSTSHSPQAATSSLPQLSTSNLPQNVAGKALPKRQLVNQSKIYLDYQIENIDTSGVGKVETWITRDLGQLWVKLCEEPHGKSPIAVQLPGDGVFGITLVACKGRGNGGTPPAPGDAPDWLVEIDTTKPSAQITKLQATMENGVPTVLVSWSVSDKNLGDLPVELYGSAGLQRPWTLIAKALKSEGQFRWTPDSGAGPLAFLRLMTRDLAGNETSTLEPVHFTDQAKLRAVIRGIRTDSAQAPQ